MKKAKIMLTSIAVIAIISGAVAFKAKSSDHIFTANPNDQTLCDQPLPSYTFDQALAVSTTSGIATETPALCPTQPVTYYFDGN